MRRIIDGDLIIKKGDNTDYSDVVKIGGSVVACEGAKLSLLNVTKGNIITKYYRNFLR